MNMTRMLTDSGRPVRDQIRWKKIEAVVNFQTKETIEIEVPESWSETAANILVSKYFRKAGVPDLIARTSQHEVGDENQPPGWLLPSIPDHNATLGSETSAHQVFHRLAGHWTYTGWKHGYFHRDRIINTRSDVRIWREVAEQNAQIFYDEIYLMLARQMAAPNSPQWFNTGLWWAYGITGEDSRLWAIGANGRGFLPYNSYQYPQVHACFINSIDDNLIEENGIFDLLMREATMFKFGSGAGSNFSKLRGKNESLSGGGKSSGLMSFLSIFDRAAGAIQSGGTTRRAAKMVIVDADHPDIEEFITLKSREERKIRALALGSTMLSKTDGGPIYSSDWEGEAVKTVDGQNANYSVRVTNEFMDRVTKTEPLTEYAWSLFNRTNGSLSKVIPIGDLWNLICKSAADCGDPGLQFHTTINSWHTCKEDGEIVASNPCSEYMFLDDTACNLASLNLMAFQNYGGSKDFNLDLFIHAVRLWTVVLDISVSMASFPSKAIAEGTQKYRTLGLGYANAGGLLMSLGLPYDSEPARSLIGGITALMQATSIKTSQELASQLGGFPRWLANKESVAHVIVRHGECAKQNAIITSSSQTYLWAKVTESFSLIDPQKPVRNAQWTVIAPTGTIRLVMDCATSGIEPEIALGQEKKLAGGGVMYLCNKTVIGLGLTTLGYAGREIDNIITHIEKTGSLDGAPHLYLIHRPMFSCALGTDPISTLGHIKMMEAVQPFISGAISKTVNMPADATEEDVGTAYIEAWKRGIKAIAIYRDASKTAQPVSAIGETPDPFKVTVNVTLPEDAMGLVFNSPNDRIQAIHNTLTENWDIHKRGFRRRPPSRSKGYVYSVRIDGQRLHMSTGEYDDGTLAQVFLVHSKEGSTARGYLEGWGKTFSLALQYGTPLDELVDAFLHVRFEPAGIVQDHDTIKMCSSVFDFVVRELAIRYLNRIELTDVKPSVIVDEIMRVEGTDSETYTGMMCSNCNGELRRDARCYTCKTCGTSFGSCG